MFEVIDNKLLISMAYNNRPNCEEILNYMKDWTLNKEDIQDMKIFEEFKVKLNHEIFINIIEFKLKNFN